MHSHAERGNDHKRGAWERSQETCGSWLLPQIPVGAAGGYDGGEAVCQTNRYQTAVLRPGFFFGSIRCENTACKSSEALSSSRLSLLSM